MAAESKSHSTQEARELVKRLRYERSLPVQSQFIREDVLKCCNVIDGLVEQLESLQRIEQAARYVMQHNPQLEGSALALALRAPYPAFGSRLVSDPDMSGASAEGNDAGSGAEVSSSASEPEAS